MKLFKFFIISTLLFASLVYCSAQNQKPKIIWKNFQENYQNFYDIKPIILNESNQPVYFDCSLRDFDPSQVGHHVEQSDNTRLLRFVEKSNYWSWNVMICGTTSKSERADAIKKNKDIEKQQKLGKYNPPGCKIEPNEEFPLTFNSEQWESLISGDMVSPYNFGKFKFVVKFWWYQSYKEQGIIISESPEFYVGTEGGNKHPDRKD